MAKTSVADWDTTAADNTDINDISLAENVMKPPAVNNAFRETMAQIAQWTSEGTIASAATCDIGAEAEEFLNVTGTTTITSFGTVRAGTKRVLLFSDALTLTHNATSLILPGAANITTAAGDTAEFVSEGSGNWRCINYQRASGQSISAPLRGHIFGLKLSNNVTDSDHDIDIAAGEAASDTSPEVLMVLASALTKRIDASWAVGTGNGGLDGTESSAGTSDASTWYYVWLIRRSDTGVVDALFSESATSPTMPTNYDQKRRIGAVFSNSLSNITLFTQSGDSFIWGTRKADLNVSTLSTSAATPTLSVPGGIPVIAHMAAMLRSTAAATTVLISSPLSTDETPTSDNHTLRTTSATPSTSDAQSDVDVVTVNGTVRVRRADDDVTTRFVIRTKGWTDTRGRLGA